MEQTKSRYKYCPSLSRWAALVALVVLSPHLSAQQEDCVISLPYYEVFDHPEDWTPYWELPQFGTVDIVEDNCWRWNIDDHHLAMLGEVYELYWPDEWSAGQTNHCIQICSRYTSLPGTHQYQQTLIGFVSLVITPELDSKPQSVSLSTFSFGYYDPVYAGDSVRKRLVVGYIADTNDWKGSFVGVDTLELTRERLVWERFTVTGFDDMPAPYHLAFFNDSLLQWPAQSLGTWQDPAPMMYRFYIDSIHIERRPWVHDTLTMFATTCQGTGYFEDGFLISAEETAVPGNIIVQDSIISEDTIHYRILHLSIRPVEHTQLVEYISPGDTVLFNGMAYTVPGDYPFTLISTDGCDSMVTLHILYHPGESLSVKIWIPNAIHPNGNGHNDVFKPVFSYPEEVENYRMEVYNRWGGLVFRTQEIESGWNACYVPEGVYRYEIHYKERNTAAKSVSGSVTVLR